MEDICQESLEGYMVEIDMPVEEINVKAPRDVPLHQILTVMEMEESNKRSLWELDSDIGASRLAEERQQQIKNLKPQKDFLADMEMLEFRMLPDVDSDIEASRLTKSGQEQEKSKNLRYEKLESKAKVEGSSKETESPNRKEPGLAERVQAHGYDKNWKLLRDAYLPKGDNLSAYWNDLLENDTFKQESPLGNTVLHVAARNGNDKLVEKISRQVPNLLTAKNSKGDTPLHVAAKSGHFSTLKILVAAHLFELARLNSEKTLEPLQEILEKNEQGNTFLHEALVNGDIRVSSSLVFQDGFKEVTKRAVVQINNEQKSALYLAIEAGNKEVVEHALDQVIPRDPDYVPEGKSPLLAAITNQDQDMLDIILKEKPEWIHLRDTEGRIPLHYAASIGYLKGVQYLLRQCPSCAMEMDKYGYYPLHLASYGGHDKVVKELLKLKHCPDPREILDNSGRNILHLAAESGKFDVVRHILQAANPELEKMINDQDANGNTPLHLATLRCHPKIVHALTWDKRVDLTLVNEEGQTALDACEPQENPSLRQRLTWLALRSAGVRSRKLPSSTIKVPPQNTKSIWKKITPNMDPYKDRINTLMLVSTLIITVTFAAGFTMPGGTNSSNPGQGMALMLNRIWFKLFIFCITISMYGAISVTIILIWAQLGDLTLAIHALRVARVLLGITLATLSPAFLAGMHLVTSDLCWLATSALVMGLVFIFMLLLLYTLLWFPSTSSNQVVRYISYYPFLLLASLVEPDEE